MDLSLDFQYHFPKGGQLSVILSISKKKPTITGILGPSGSGKSTLLHCIAGVQKADCGHIKSNGITYFDSEKKVNLPAQNRSTTLLFQEAPLFPHLSISKNISYGLKGRSKVDLKMIVSEWCERFALKDKSDRYPDELSGGERQRVALAQTLAPSPQLLLLDEPLSALDPVTRIDIRKKLRSWIIEHQRSALIVTHDLAEALAFSDHLMIMSEGRILQHGKPMEIFSRPNLPEVAKIVGVENLLSGTVLKMEAGLVHVSVGKTELDAIGSVLPTQSCFVAIRSEEVILESGQAIKSSARNHLKGRVQEIISYGSQVGVVIDCGFLLNARITEQSRQELHLHSDSEITVVIKASAIQVFPVE